MRSLTAAKPSCLSEATVRLYWGRRSEGTFASAASSFFLASVHVDASNVAHASEKDSALLANVRLIRDKLTEDGMTPILVADAALRHQIDDGDGYEALVKAGEIQQAPAGTDADDLVD